MATVVGSKRKEEEKGTAAYSTAPFPLGFKFSPSDEQLVDHYLRLKNEGCESEVQIIAEVDVYNYEPWDLPELSVIKSDQREWFFFCRTDAELDLHLFNPSRKVEKAYMEPTGPEAGWSTHEDPSFWPWLTHDALSPSQTHVSLSHSLRSTSNQLNSGSNVASNSSVKNDVNLFPPDEAKQLVRTTAAGYWKSTGKDCSIRSCDGLNIGMKKTLIFYKGRAPNGTRTDWIMYVYSATKGDFAGTSAQQDTFVLCHLFQKEEFDDIKEDKIYTSVSSLITAKSSYADNWDPLDLNSDPPDLAKEVLLQFDEFLLEPFAEEGIEKRITPESKGMVFEVEAVEMKSSSGEKIKEIGVEFEASGQDKKFEIEEIGIEPETSDIDRKTFSIIQGEPHQSCLMWGGLGLTETPKEEDWENAKKIYLMDNQLSVLPKNPRCPVLSTLFLQRNYKLRIIPPSFFDCMPALQILNLSRTGIKSLPDSVLRLVSLKRLFLNDCHCFMILSPKVGKLQRLEVLDLEGTDIMDLPKEIKELTNLTCLKVSLYACMSNGRRAMQSDVVVPCGIISALSHLEELMISVNPDDKRWNACVEAIVTEVCSLQSLNTIKFYFPRVELVRHFLLSSPMWVHPSLSNFKFVVGHHVQRTMSRLPRDVEFELERWERCLKYINGVAVPREIQKVLQYSTAFFLERHATAKKLSDFGIGNIKQLKCCVVGECNEVELIIDATDAHAEESEADAHEGDSETDTYEEDSVVDAHEEDNEAGANEEDDEVEACREDGSSEIVSKTSSAKTIVLGSLEYLYIYYMKNLRRIWKGPVQPKCLSLLKFLTLRTCPQLTTIFTIGLLDNLYNLEELIVEDCPSIKTLVSCKISTKPKTSDFLPSLKRISLHYMPGLVSISSGLHIAPRLEWLSFYNCPNLKHLLIEEVSSKDLKKIKGEWNWWVALKWISGRPSYLDDIFVPINI